MHYSTCNIIMLHSLEQSGEGICVWLRNLADFGTRRTQIAQIQMNGKVAQLAQLQQNELETN